MRITVRAVKDLARNSGFTEDLIDRHLDLLISFTLGVAHRERKYCRSQLRKWIHNDEIDKPHLLDVLREPEEDEHLKSF